ncbi:MAG: hypothetical protein M3281_04000 [Chloroflexota bacterium]|nr:hypothetical protein [Chloroflexota bacterium]
MVTVYFTTGEEAKVKIATAAKLGDFPEGSSGSSPLKALLCYDADDHEVGCFRLDKVCGWYVDNTPQEAGQRR